MCFLFTCICICICIFICICTRIHIFSNVSQTARRLVSKAGLNSFASKKVAKLRTFLLCSLDKEKWGERDRMNGNNQLGSIRIHCGIFYLVSPSNRKCTQSFDMYQRVNDARKGNMHSFNKFQEMFFHN